MNIKRFRNIWLPISLVILALVLVACGGTTGQPEPTAEVEPTAEAEPTIEVEPTAAPVEPTAEPQEEPTAEPLPEATEEPAEETAACPEPAADNQLLRHDASGYCFLYPLEYDVFEGDDGSITLYVGSLMNIEDPTMSVWVRDAAGQTAEQAADEATTGLPEDFGHTRSETTIAGETAVVLDNMPGQDLNRRIFFVYDGRLYDLIVNRTGPEYGEIGQRAEALYQMVSESFQLVPVVPDAPLQAGLECPPETADTVLLRNEEHGYCLLYPADYMTEQPNESETVIFVGSLLNVEDPKLFITVEDAGGRTAQEAADALVAEFDTAMGGNSGIERSFGLMVDGVFAEQLDNVPGQDLSRQIITVNNGRLYKLTFVPYGEDAGEVFTEMEALSDLAIASFSFLP